MGPVPNALPPNSLDSGTVNKVQYSILPQMVKSISDPALVVQVFLMTLCSSSYYDRIIMFDKLAPSSQVTLLQVTRPLGWTAFAIVASVAVLHLLLVLLAALVFRQAGDLGQIQNAWASISQLLGPTTDDWIKKADNVDDKMVRLWLKDRGVDKTLVQVTRVENRVQLIENSVFIGLTAPSYIFMTIVQSLVLDN